MTCESVDLPEPFGPMIAWTSPSFTVSDSPWRISRSSTRTCKFLTSSSDIQLPFKTNRRAPPAEACNAASADAAFQRNRNQLLSFHREFHRQLLQHILNEAVDDQANRLFLAQAALHAI